jgi:hypothetical protein
MPMEIVLLRDLLIAHMERDKRLNPKIRGPRTKEG